MLTITVNFENNEEIVETFNSDEFQAAIEFCESQFGYEGLAWDMVKETLDLEELQDFLAYDGVDAFL